MSDFDIKRGSREIPFEQTLVFSGDLTGCTVLFKMTKRGDTVPTVNAFAIVVDAALRSVRYSWADGDTNVAGVYDAEFEVTFPGGAKESFPRDRYYDIRIRPELNGVPLPPPDLSGILLVTAPLQSTGGGTPLLSIAAATQSARGTMSALDKIKLDALAIPSATTTTDATPTTLASYVVPDDSLVRFRCTISAKKRSANVSAAYVIECTFDRYSAGAASEVGAGSIDSVERVGAESWSATYDTDGSNTVRFRFTGAAASTIDLIAKLDVSVTP